MKGVATKLAVSRHGGLLDVSFLSGCFWLPRSKSYSPYAADNTNSVSSISDSSALANAKSMARSLG